MQTDFCLTSVVVRGFVQQMGKKPELDQNEPNQIPEGLKSLRTETNPKNCKLARTGTEQNLLAERTEQNSKSSVILLYLLG